MALRLLLSLVSCVLTLSAADRHDYASKIAPLIDPAKLATLKTRGAIPRVPKIVYPLEMPRRNDVQPAEVIASALGTVGMTNALAAKVTKEAMLRNLAIADRLGCLSDEGLKEMRRGRSPTIRAGPYAGEELSVDHIIPIKVARELDNVIANLELMPLRMNKRKSDRVLERQRALAVTFYQAGLLSAQGYQAVIGHK